MKIQTHISTVTIDEQIDRYIEANECDAYENGPIALQDLFEFILRRIVDGSISDPKALCAHVMQRLNEYRENE